MKFIIFPGNDDVFYKMFEEVNDAKKYPNINIYKNIYLDRFFLFRAFKFPFLCI